MTVSLAGGFASIQGLRLQSHHSLPLERYNSGQRHNVSIERFTIIRRFLTWDSPFSMIAGFSSTGLFSELLGIDDCCSYFKLGGFWMTRYGFYI